MTQYAIVTDLNRCVGCLACSVACKVVNDVPVGNYWNKVLRVGPNPVQGGSGHSPMWRCTTCPCSASTVKSRPV